jgi:hypothetical protein
MKKTSLLLSLFFAVIALPAWCQQYRTVELKPITQQGWRYYYDLKKVSSPVALEMPLMAVNDDEVNRYLKGSKNWNAAASFVTLIPLIYILTLPNNSYVDSSTFWWVIGGTAAVQLGMTAISHIKLGKSIDRYNMLILRPSGRSLGLEVTYKF